MQTFNTFDPPKYNESIGGLHPINQVKDFLINLLKDIGFSEEKGPEIESEEFNFYMLNIKK
jgi:phenylalanyl-tRNA synthetase alpha chain